VRSDQEIASALRKVLNTVAGARIAVAPIRTVANVGPDIQIELRAHDLRTLATAASTVRDSIETVPGVLNPDVSLRTGQRELRVELDRTLSAAADIPPALAGSILRDTVDGAQAGYLRLDDENVPIHVALADRYLQSPEMLSIVPVGYSRKRAVLLGDIARFVQSTSPASIERLDGNRLVTVTASLAPGNALGNVRTAIEDAVRGKLPQGVEMHFGGETSVMEESIPHFALAVTLAVTLVFLVMAALFNSWLYPLIIMLTLPMALIGGLAALAIAGDTLSLVSAIGIIMLIGLMGRNAILLVDYANTLRARGMPAEDAIVEAGATRLRPIMMTTLATIFGMLPVALRIGTASELRASMAIVVIGGLIVSTVLTLVVIPCAYAIAAHVDGGTLMARRR
jgi:HAE1 family hydrophobic/amphiphilic exporter-1